MTMGATLAMPMGLVAGAITETSIEPRGTATGFSVFYSTSSSFDPKYEGGTEFAGTLDSDATSVVVTGLAATHDRQPIV